MDAPSAEAEFGNLGKIHAMTSNIVHCAARFVPIK